MFRLSGKFAVLQKLNHIPRITTNAVSGKNFTSGSSCRSSSDGNGGSQEKEICLFGPIDVRTPLPGNMGIPPMSMFANNTIQQLPKPSGDKCEIITKPLPEERYDNVCSQAIVAAGADILFRSGKIEYAAYTCPTLLKEDFLDLFPGKDLSRDFLSVITICRKTENDMSTWSEESEAERVKHEKCFIMIAEMLVSHLNSFNHWAEFIHPTYGTAFSRKSSSKQIKDIDTHLTNDTMYQTDVRYAHFGFRVEDMGCCKVISHHEWGTNMFVGAVFTNARLQSQEVQMMLNKDKLFCT